MPVSENLTDNPTSNKNQGGVQSLEIRSGRRRPGGGNREDVLYRQGADVLRV